MGCKYRLRYISVETKQLSPSIDYRTVSEREEQHTQCHGFMVTKHGFDLDTINHAFPEPSSFVPVHDKVNIKIADWTTGADLFLTILLVLHPQKTIQTNF